LWVVLLAFLGAGAVLGGPHALAWYHLRAGTSALKSYHNDDARAHLDACLKIWPTHVGAHLLAARAERRAGDYVAATQHVLDAQEANGGSSQEIALENALVNAGMGNVKGNEDFLHAKAAKEPALAPLVWEALAEGYMRMHRIPDAFACCDRWLERDPDNVQGLYLRGWVASEIQSTKRAIPDLRRVVELDPKRDDARRKLAFNLVKAHYLDEALEHLEYLHRRDPSDLEVEVRIARCEHGLGNGKKAKTMLDQVVAEHPDYGPGQLASGHVDRLAGRLADAEEKLRTAIKLMPYDYQAYWELKSVLQRRGKDDEARTIEDKADLLKKAYERRDDLLSHELGKKPHDPAVHYEMGMVEISLGQRESGAFWLTSALNEDPNYAPAHAALAEYYHDLGDSDAAEHHRQRAAELKSTNQSPDKSANPN
jgi:tetratricopeptide (TPR) repeat protein